MARQSLYVQPYRGKWTVHTDEQQGDDDMPAYESKEDAVVAAILSAENSNEKGQAAQVMVKDASDGEFRLERSFDGT